MTSVISKTRHIILCSNSTLNNSFSGSSIICNSFYRILINERKNNSAFDITTKPRFLCSSRKSYQNTIHFNNSFYAGLDFGVLSYKTNRFPFNTLHCFYSTQKTSATMASEKDTTSTDSSKMEENPKTVSRKDMLKKAMKEYGSTVIVFHISLALMSLGTCYLLVSSGVDMLKVLSWLGFSNETTTKLASASGTFVIAYAIHKMTAPVRISITLGATPFIVRYLRTKGWLKKP